MTLNKTRVRLIDYLASQRAEPKCIYQAPATNLTSVGDPFSGPRLWPLIQKYNLCTVNNVRLHARYVYVPLNLTHSHHIMVRGSSYLQ